MKYTYIILLFIFLFLLGCNSVRTPSHKTNVTVIEPIKHEESNDVKPTRKEIQPQTTQINPNTTSNSDESQIKNINTNKSVVIEQKGNVTRIYSTTKKGETNGNIRNN